MDSKLKQDVELRLVYDTVIQLYNSRLGEGKPINGNMMYLCPFHTDKQGSFSVNPSELGLYHCFGCNKSGNVYTFLKEACHIDKPLIYLAKKFDIPVKEEKKIVPTLEILEAKKFLQNSKEMLRVLNEFGITNDIIDRFNIGFHQGRFWFPIRDEYSEYVNVRKYDPFGKSQYKMMSYGKDYGSARIFPIENLNSDEVYLFEGEKDCLVALSLGYNAITVTGGANTWKKEWNALFKNKSVIICYDVDQAGINGAKKIADELYHIAAQIKIIKLPITEIENGDFTDYISKLGHGKQDFDTLVNDTAVYMAEKESDDTEYKTLLAEASKALYINKKCDIKNIIVCGRDTSPYGAPKKIKFFCNSPANSKKCSICPVSNEPCTIELKKTDYAITEFVGASRKSIGSIMRDVIKIPCDKMQYETLDYYSIDRLRLTPNTSYNIEEDYKHVIRTGLYVSDKNDDKEIETNKTYNIKATTILSSDSQSVIHQIYEASHSETNIDEFKLTDEINNQLKVFQANGSIKEKLDSIYNEFSQMSHIYGREHLMMMYDLVFHSALTFNFQGDNIGKGWVEAVAVGDSGVGKSHLIKWLQRYYKAGELVDGETVSEAGLKGGLSQNNGVWSLQWGRLPINDRRLVIIDEASGLTTEAIGNMSNIRSSGECVVHKIISDKTRSRTRIIWITNPRRQNTGITQYSHGVETIKDFFGKPEDVRRCDIGMTIASGEVSIDVINQPHRTIIPQYTSEACHNLVVFAWSRKSADINITKESEALILSKAKEFGKKYSAVIPLVEASDVRNKIARLSVAFAIRLYAVDDNGIVVIAPDHVKYICNWLDQIYSLPRFQYNKFSEKENRKLELKDHDTIDLMLRIDSMSTEQEIIDNIHDLLDYSVIDKTTLSSIMGVSVQSDDFQMKLHKLRRCNAVIVLERKIILNPCLLDYLRKKEWSILNKSQEF